MAYFDNNKFVSGNNIKDILTKVKTYVDKEMAVSVDWKNISGKPVTLSGYGITDAYIDESTSSIVLGNDIIIPITVEVTTNISNYDESHDGKLVLDLGDSDSDDDLYFAINGEYKKLTSEKDISKLSDEINKKADKSITLSGYGITDAKIDGNTITLGSSTITPLTANSTLSSSNLDNHSMSIAGASVNLGGSITAKTIGAALDSSSPAVYATTAGSANSVAWGNVSGKPSLFTPSGHNQEWSTITSTPTTIAGYGIKDAYTKTEIDEKFTDNPLTKVELAQIRLIIEDYFDGNSDFLTYKDRYKTTN